MRLVISKIPDVTKSNINESKQILAHSIINNVYPLFDEIQKAKDDNVNTLKYDVSKTRKALKNEKENLETLMSEYKRRKKVSKLLDRVQSLINAGLVYDSSIKHEMIILLKIVDKLTDDKLEMHLGKTMHLLSKRFSK